MWSWCAYRAHRSSILRSVCSLGHTSCNHRVFLESALVFRCTVFFMTTWFHWCYKQLPAYSPRAWKLHASMHESIVLADWVSTHSRSHKNFAGWHSLEKLWQQPFGAFFHDLRIFLPREHWKTKLFCVAVGVAAFEAGGPIVRSMPSKDTGFFLSLFPLNDCKI